MSTPTANPSAAQRHLDALTWLRGFAAFLVIISHSVRATESAYFGNDAIVPALFRFLDLGNFGVGLFFALSGCTLYLSNGHIRGARGTALFYFRRFMRIWPAFAVSLLAYLAFMEAFRALYPLRDGHWVEHALLADYGVADLLRYLSLSFNITGPEEYFNGAYWSLPVEFQYYLLFPLLLLSMRRTSILGPIIICGLLYVAFWFDVVEPDRHEVLSLAYVFGGGMLCGYLYERTSFRISPWIAAGIVAVLFVVVSLVRNDIIPLLPIPPFGRKWDWFGSVGVVMVATVLFARVPRSHGPLARFGRHYGDISYSTYLFHNIFVAIAVIAIVHLKIPAAAQTVFVFLVAVTGTYFLAVASYRWVEVPSIAAGKRLARRKDRRTPPQAATPEPDGNAAGPARDDDQSTTVMASQSRGE